MEKQAEQKTELINPVETQEKKQTEQKTKENKKPEKKPIIKKDYAKINVKDLHMSTKQAVAICNFIKNKTPELAIKQLEQVINMKRAIPMKGEIPHRKGMMSGRYPINATKIFIKLIKQLVANAEVNELEEPIIIQRAIPNQAARPMRRSGSQKFKRTHVQLIAVEKNKPEVKN